MTFFIWNDAFLNSLLDANKFITGLPPASEVVEREAASFTIEVKDPDAPVEFFIAGQKITGNDNRQVFETQM